MHLIEGFGIGEVVLQLPVVTPVHLALYGTELLVLALRGEEIGEGVGVVSPESQISTVGGSELELGQDLQLTPEGADKLVGVVQPRGGLVQHSHRVGDLLEACGRQGEDAVSILHGVRVLRQDAGSGLLIGIDRHQGREGEGTSQNGSILRVGLDAGGLIPRVSDVGTYGYLVEEAAVFRLKDGIG